MPAPTRVQRNIRQVVPFFWVHDLPASLRFYVDGLGFSVTKQWEHEGRLRWCWLERDDVALMLQEFWQEGHHANLPAERVGVGVSIAFMCEDAVAIYHDVMARGVSVRRPFVANGLWVTEVTDPDGYRLVFESVTDAPEESILPDDA